MTGSNLSPAAVSVSCLLLWSATTLAPAAANDAGTAVIALTLPESNTTSGYFPLSKALRSVMLLAAADVNGGALVTTSGTPVEGNLTLSVVEVATGSTAIEGLCEALSSVGENGTFGIVGPMLSSQASLLETVSNDFFGLPMVTPAAPAARAATYFSSGARDLGGGEGSYLLGVQPDVFQEMEALARLILDLKTERDLDRGWNYPKERVSVVYPDSAYGTIAASAFVRAVRSTEGINVDSNAAGEMPSMIELVRSEPVAFIEGTDYRPTLSALTEAHASIVVLLSEGFDGVFVRSVLEQALEVGLAGEGVQWFFSGSTAMDGIFTLNDTYRDAQLAYDFRGAMGVRACPAIEGPGSEVLANLTSRWAALDSEQYPGAGFGTLTPDGRLDPLLAYAYDAVFAVAAAVFSVKQEARQWGGVLDGFIAESCPFRTEGLWEDGQIIREAVLATELVGVTGNLAFMQGTSTVTSGAGTAGSGWREANGTVFCALNLQPHASLGATFATTMTWQPDTVVDTNGTASTFEKISPYQKNQTFPAGSDVYPFDRPTLNRQHIEVVTEEAAVPFAIITGRENETRDYEGIAMDLLQVLSEKLGFTYNITVANSSVSTDEVVGYVANGTFDMVASWVTISERMMETVSFSYPYMGTGLSFVYRPEVSDEVSWWKMFQPFENTLWVAVVLSTVLTLSLLWLFDGAKSDIFTDGVPSETGSKRRFKSGMAVSSYVTGALLLGQMAHEPFTVESYILTMGWMFTCFILGASFTAELASFLAAEKEEALSFGVDDLKNGAVPHSQVALRQGTSMQAFYEEEIMRCFGEEECYGGLPEDTPVACYSVEECFALVENGTCKATVVDFVAAQYRVADEYCGLDILPDTFNDEHFGLVLPKESPFLSELETAMLELQEDGIITKISERYFDTSRCAYLEAYEDASATSQNLTLFELAGVFMVLGMFVVASLIAWVFRKGRPEAKRRWSDYREHQERRKSLREEEPVGNVDDDLDTRLNSWPRLSILSAPFGPSSSKSASTVPRPGRQDKARPQLGSAGAPAGAVARRRKPSARPPPIEEGSAPTTPSQTAGGRRTPPLIRSLRAHVIYGWVGLVLAMAALCHAAYQLNRQLRFHAQLLAPWTTCAEQCRRGLHVTSVIVAMLSMIYFAMVLKDELQWSVYVLAVTQFPVNISCSFYATRMWIYAIDPRLMRRSPEVLAISLWMEKPFGSRVTCSMMWIAPLVALIFDLAGLTHHGMRAMAVGILFLAVAIGITFVIGGSSLVNAINESLRQQEQQRQKTATALTVATAVTAGTGRTRGDRDEDEQENDAPGGGDGGGGSLALPGEGDQSLLAARKKVVRMMVFALQNVVMVIVALLVTIFTGYAVAAPLPIYVVPVTYVPLVWDIVHVQLHAGRSKVRSRSRRGLLAASVNGRYRRPSRLLGLNLSRTASSVYLAFVGNQQQIVPTQEYPEQVPPPAE
eukprot:g13093.t1